MQLPSGALVRIDPNSLPIIHTVTSTGPVALIPETQMKIKLGPVVIWNVGSVCGAKQCALP